jgi:hypothetical protein
MLTNYYKTTMSEITPKLPEVIQAQAAAFAAERIGDIDDKRAVFNRITDLAIGASIDVTRVTERDEWLKNEKGQKYKVPEGMQVIAATPHEYIDFLRSMDAETRMSVTGRASMLKAYAEFGPLVKKLKSEFIDQARRNDHPQFLGGGGNSGVFSIERNGKKYAVRIPIGKSTDPSSADAHVAAAVLGKGVPHIEQIVAASYEDGVTVAEVMPGMEFSNISVEEVEKITDDQLSELVDTLRTMDEKGIGVDPRPPNFFYDPREGFGIIDYDANKRGQNISQTTAWASSAIRNMGTYGKHYNFHRTKKDYGQFLALEEAKLNVLKRYRGVVEAQLIDTDRETALLGIDEDIAAEQSIVDNYSNPQWLAEFMESERVRLEKLAEYEAASAERKRLKAEQGDRATSPSDGWARMKADQL